MSWGIRDILSISDEKQLIEEFFQFGAWLAKEISPLEELLNTAVINMSEQELMNHGSHVEAWRNRISRHSSSCLCFLEHAKGAFYMDKTGGPEDLRKAHQKKLSAGMTALSDYLEKTIVSIDSRVNLTKKYLDILKTGHKPIA